MSMGEIVISKVRRGVDKANGKGMKVVVIPHWQAKQFGIQYFWRFRMLRIITLSFYQIVTQVQYHVDWRTWHELSQYKTP